MANATETPQQSVASECERIRLDHSFDLLRGVAEYTASPLVAALAKTVAAFPDAALDIAFNHKQIACKVWARDALFEHLGPAFGTVWVLGGWYGVMAAILLDDRRFDIGHIRSIDFDPAVAPVAHSLNAEASAAGRFSTSAADMYGLDYRIAGARPDLVINTSCEHIPDLEGWLALLPPGMPVLLQSNNYANEPSHVNIVGSLEHFAATAALSRVVFAGELQLKHYTRFMLIGQR
ncbi:MAG: class I SAM-dependent methyltransferase [Aestuariivirgaceae bacterium]